MLRDSFEEMPDAVVVLPARDVVAHRFVVNPRCPVPDDFRSNYEKATKPQPEELEFVPEYMGLSMWLSPQMAEFQWRSVPSLNRRYKGLAVVRLDVTKGVWFAHEPDDGHLTVWGRPKDFIQLVEGHIPLA